MFPRSSCGARLRRWRLYVWNDPPPNRRAAVQYLFFRESSSRRGGSSCMVSPGKSTGEGGLRAAPMTALAPPRSRAHPNRRAGSPPLSWATCPAAKAIAWLQMALREALMMGNGMNKQYEHSGRRMCTRRGGVLCISLVSSLSMCSTNVGPVLKITCRGFYIVL